MRVPTTLAACAALLMLLGGAAVAAEPGARFEHKDWQVDCDNPGTCRASGYQRDEDTTPVSVLLTRAAGPGAPVQAQVQFGDFDDNGDKPAADVPVHMTIGGHAMGTVVDNEDMAPAQVAALLKALTGSGAIVFASRDTRWMLSGDGAAAVLLKMDDVQGRIGTPGALVRKGTKPEASVPGPVKPPVIQAVRVPAPVESDVPLALRILKTIPKTADCDDLQTLQAAPQPDTADVDLWRLGGGRVLVSALCWRGAYNAGNGYWIARDKPPYDAKVVTLSADTFTPEAGELSGSAKGRGIGDCMWSATWVWDGRDFVHATEATTGMCRMVAPGGPWDLPTLVSEVRKPR